MTDATGPLWVIENDDVRHLADYYPSRSPTGLPVVVAGGGVAFYPGVTAFPTEDEALTTLAYLIDTKREYYDERAEAVHRRLKELRS